MMGREEGLSPLPIPATMMEGEVVPATMMEGEMQAGAAADPRHDDEGR